MRVFAIKKALLIDKNGCFASLNTESLAFDICKVYTLQTEGIEGIKGINQNA
jgi:hypothetical protein